MTAGRQRVAPKRARKLGAPELVRTLGEVQEQLVRAALSAGLQMARPRSLPDRLSREAQGFLVLLAVALRTPSSRATERALEEEARRGAFARSDLAAARRVLDVWRGVLRSFVAGHPGIDRRGAVEAALARIAERLEAVLARVAGERIDIIAVGASAGGIPALGALLGPLDPAMAATVVVVLHTHERSPMMLPLVLGRTTRLPIAYPVERGHLLLGHVYIAPPGLHLAVRDGRMRLLATPPVCLSRPSIDVLFTSVAASFGPRVASVVLSGTNRDGAEGTRAVREHGGLTFAQSPADAEFGFMPAASISTGAVQHVAPAAAIGRELARRLAGERPAPARVT